jgi:hypothetical protein
MVLRSAAILLLLATPAFAQTSTVIPPAPPVVAAPPAAPAPATPSPSASTPTQIGQTPAQNFDNGSTQPAPATPDQSTLVTAPPPATTAPAIPNTWLPGTSATLGVLNTVDGTSSQVTIQVGGHAVIGDMTVSVLACANRPPTQVPDAAIFLTTAPTASANIAPGFRGWLIRSMPGATVAGDAGEVFRVVNCASS